MRQIMRSSLDYAGFAQLCGRSPIMRKIMRAHNRIIPRSLLWTHLPASLHQPHTNLSNSASPSSLSGTSSVPSTHHSHHPSPPLSFIPGLKPSFSANPSHRSLLFFLQDWLHGFAGLFTDISEHIHFLIFHFSVFHKLLVSYRRLSWLMPAFERTIK